MKNQPVQANLSWMQTNALASRVIGSTIVVPDAHRRPMLPETSLLAAIMETAVEDATRVCRCMAKRYCYHATQRRNAIDWINGSDVERGWTFAYICDTLGLDAQAARAAVTKLTETRP